MRKIGDGHQSLYDSYRQLLLSNIPPSYPSLEASLENQIKIYNRKCVCHYDRRHPKASKSEKSDIVFIH